MVVGLCSFYEVFLKVVFKKVVFYNEKVTFRNIRRKKIQLIASELNSLRQVRMRIYVYKWHACPGLYKKNKSTVSSEGVRKGYEDRREGGDGKGTREGRGWQWRGWEERRREDEGR